MPAVRRGLRMAFSRARRPVIPRKRATGAPRIRPPDGPRPGRGRSRRRSAGTRRAGALEQELAGAGEGGVRAPGRGRSRVNTAPTTRRAPGRRRCSRPRRRAGRRAAAPATPGRPGTAPATHRHDDADDERDDDGRAGFTTRPPAGSSAPRPLNTALRPMATSSPTKKPITERHEPHERASRRARTAGPGVSTRRRARSSADSRVRCATRIVNVL